VSAEDSWQYRQSPYIWFAGLKGDVATIPGLPSAPIDISPSDALDDTEASLMLNIDAKKGQHGFYGDLLYSDIRSEDELVPAPINLVLESKTKTTILTLAYQYELYNQDQKSLDLLVGGRYWKVDSKLSFQIGPGQLGGRTLKNDESWVDPAIGIKGRMPLGDSQFFLHGGAGVGGWGSGSDHFYDVNGNIGYQWSEKISTSVGYRMFSVDYDDDGFVYDAKQKGWLIGLTMTF
jgi:hypothetical protein